MRRITLGTTGIDVSALGFGCVRLTAHARRQEAVDVLNQALDCGITHFDVARLYGFGRAEGILGEFLKGKRDRVTVATKFGLVPPGGLAGKRWIIDTVKKSLGPFPALLRWAKRRAVQQMQTGAFSPAAAEQSFQTSLRELGTDYVDLLLLHECTIADATNQPLIELLQRQIARGTVRCVGVASEFGALPLDAALLPAVHQVIQFNHNASTRNLPRWQNTGPRTLITHGVFGPARRLNEAIRAHPQTARRFATELNVDLFDAGVINSLLLQFNLQSNPNGVTLFSSTDAAHLRANAKTAEANPYDQRQMSRFVEMVDEFLAPADQAAKNSR